MKEFANKSGKIFSSVLIGAPLFLSVLAQSADFLRASCHCGTLYYLSIHTVLKSL